MKSRMDAIVNVIKDELSEALSNNRKSLAHTVIDILTTNTLWAEKFKPIITEIFPPNSEPIWLHWPENVVEDRVKLLDSFLKISDEFADWIVKSIFDLLKVKTNKLNHGYASYRNHHTIYINIILKQLINNENIAWESFLENAMEENLYSHLDTDTVDSLIIFLGKKMKLNNQNYNDFFIEYHNVESEYHQDNAINRWDFLNSTGRKTYLEKYDSYEKFKTEFGAKLLINFKTKPHVHYIDELESWSFNKKISEKIVETIIQKVDETKLNIWFQDSIIKIIKGIDHWTMFALSYATRTRKDFAMPKRETLDTLLLLKDERSVLSLNIVKRDKNIANTLRSSIGSLKDTYPNEVDEVKKAFRWRKL